MLPIYWLINMSFKTTTEIINTYSLWPQKFTLENYVKIFTDSTWYMGYVNSITYTVFNTVISVAAALPAAAERPHPSPASTPAPPSPRRAVAAASSRPSTCAHSSRFTAEIMVRNYQRNMEFKMDRRLEV